MTTVAEAEALARSKLAVPLPRRWRHVQSVARLAYRVAERLSLPEDLVTAAWLHDIGYAPELVETGFHALDGARYLRRIEVGERIVSLVAYHSYAPMEAEVRGLGDVLAREFFPADQTLSDVLCYCDMTTGPGGEHVQAEDRLAEIRSRYGPDHEVTKFIERATPQILASAGKIEELLAVQPR